jgi:uncharacterized protein (DUF1778 family)
VAKRLRPKDRRSVRVQVRFRRDELQLVERVAAMRGTPRSAWIRAAISAAVSRMVNQSPNANAAPEEMRRAPSDGDGLGRREQA